MQRRLILRISVDWVPPDVRPSGACLARGRRVCFSLFTPSRVAPHRGGVSSDARSQPRKNGGRASNGLGLWSQRDRLGNGSHTRAQLSRNGNDHVVGVCPAGDQPPIALAQAFLGLPTELLDGLEHLLQSQLERPTDVGRVARGPGRENASAVGGVSKQVRAPERMRRARVMASCRLVLTRSPGFWGIKGGATTQQP